MLYASHILLITFHCQKQKCLPAGMLKPQNLTVPVVSDVTYSVHNAVIKNKTKQNVKSKYHGCYFYLYNLQLVISVTRRSLYETHLMPFNLYKIVYEFYCRILFKNFE